LTLDPGNMTYKLNIAAVFYEQKKYEDCISACLVAAEMGRENRAGICFLLLWDFIIDFENCFYLAWKLILKLFF
jgi:hypothetical protein